MDIISVPTPPAYSGDNAASCGIVSSDDGQGSEKKMRSSIDVWNSILSKNEGMADGVSSGDKPSCYVHPMVKRTSSSLSEKSLEVCTESLGSETGSDGFSLYPTLETHDDSDSSDDDTLEGEEESTFVLARYRSFDSSLSSRKFSSTVPKQFPPLISSLSQGGGGSSYHLCCHRRDGRLIVEAVSMPSENVFRARRQNGRLLLSLEAYGKKQEETFIEEEEDEEKDHSVPGIDEQDDGKEYVVHQHQISRGCKEQRRRSMLVWKPYCIATS